MSVSGISSVTNPYPSAPQSAATQRRAAFRALASALQSGDLAGAQKAFATLQPSGSNGQGTQGPLSSDFNALASALQAGDLGAAQKAFATLQQDMQKVQGHHHHHHHHGRQQQASAIATMDGSTIDLQT
jgi:hypothetical protein